MHFKIILRESLGTINCNLNRENADPICIKACDVHTAITFAGDCINDLIYTIHTEFRSQIWKPRCIKLDTFKSSINVSLSTQNPTMQRTTTSCKKRDYSHFNIDSRMDRPNNWVSWISEKVSQNKLWSNFSRYVNSLRIF